MSAGKEPKRQSDRFLETARELECDEDEDRFNETLKRIAPDKAGNKASKRSPAFDEG